MSDLEVAESAVDRNDQVIKESLLEKGIMFDDELVSLPVRPALDMIPEVIERKYDLGDRVVCRIEHEIENVYRGIMWIQDEDTQYSIDFLISLLETRYKR